MTGVLAQYGDGVDVAVRQRRRLQPPPAWGQPGSAGRDAMASDLERIWKKGTNRGLEARADTE
jgi:hypothetical protein